MVDAHAHAHQNAVFQKKEIVARRSRSVEQTSESETPTHKNYSRCHCLKNAVKGL